MSRPDDAASEFGAENRGLRSRAAPRVPGPLPPEGGGRSDLGGNRPAQSEPASGTGNEAPPGLGVTRFAARGTTRLAYEAIGGPGASVVVALHDLLADRAVWRPWAIALASGGYRLLLPDARGHGASAALSTRPYPPTELAADVLAILDAEGTAAVHLAGHGWGAATALAVAQLGPARVASLLLLQPDLAGLLAHDDDPAVRWVASVARESRSAAAAAAGKGQTDRALDALLEPRLGRGWQARLPRLQLAAIRRYAGSLGALLGGAEGHEPAPAGIRALAMPALVLRHAAAPEPDALVAERLAGLLPAASAPLPTGTADDARTLSPSDPEVIAAALAFLGGVHGRGG